ncbi:cleavage and polyadenylation specificity factor subunit 1-like [Numida meleagris]|uniref:cleavage and polyadenylation specificity factor subunit 1-like n=1 Tax=Numida meleagris TaxID=8996 RepID=UPI000B3DCADA|nr:cleavage and polyadenylation specificity factor subunit 1-like [Numida meleagris]
MKSISLLRYQEESKTLSLVSRDAKPLEVYSVDFMVDSTQLGFLVSDRDRNLLVYMYLPEGECASPSLSPSPRRGDTVGG